MYSMIEHNAQAEWVVNKSRFLADAILVENERQALDALSEVRKKYHDARHHCFAYVLQESGIMRMSDDGEPQGTAGMPILGVIQARQLSNVLIVVTRYFGGILLGAGGLTRAYSKSASLALDLAGRMRVTEASVIELTATYPVWAKIEAYLKKREIEPFELEYQERVSGKVALETDAARFKQAIVDLTAGEAQVEDGGYKRVCRKES